MKNFRLKAEVRLLLTLVLGAFVALFFLGFRYIGRHTDFGDATALGAQTNSVFASNGPYQIHCAEALEDCLLGIEFRHRASLIIWLGNSQLHAINNYLQGDLNAPALLANRVERKGADLVTFSQGNANLQEQYVVYEYVRTRVKISQLILPVVFDDFREDGLRDELAVLLKSETVKHRLSETAFGSRLTASINSKIASGFKSPDNSPQYYVEAIPDRGLEPSIHLGQAPGQMQVGTFSSLSRLIASINTKIASGFESPDNSPQYYVEAILDRVLESRIHLWQARGQMRGDIFLSLYRLRNTLFGITPNTKRKVIPNRYFYNLSALDALLKSATEAGIKVVMYIAPINTNNGEFPYDKAEYQRFKDGLEILAQKYGVTYRNFENLIPKSLWGRKNSTTIGGEGEIDYMHFTSAGHLVLADQIEPLLTNFAPEGKQRK